MGNQTHPYALTDKYTKMLPPKVDDPQIYKIRHNETDQLYYLKEYRHVDQQKKQLLLHRIREREKQQSSHLYPVVDWQYEAKKNVCSQQQVCCMIAKQPSNTLQCELETRRVDKTGFTNDQICAVVKGAAHGLQDLNKLGDEHRCVDLSSIFINGQKVYLEDPLMMPDELWMAEGGYLNKQQIPGYPSPQKLHYYYDTLSQFEHYPSDLFSLGVVALQMCYPNTDIRQIYNYTQKQFRETYENPMINDEVLEYYVEGVSDSRVRQLIKTLTDSNSKKRLRVFQQLERLQVDNRNLGFGFNHNQEWKGNRYVGGADVIRTSKFYMPVSQADAIKQPHQTPINNQPQQHIYNPPQAVYSRPPSITTPINHYDHSKSTKNVHFNEKSVPTGPTTQTVPISSKPHFEANIPKTNYNQTYKPYTPQLPTFNKSIPQTDTTMKTNNFISNPHYTPSNFVNSHSLSANDNNFKFQPFKFLETTGKVDTIIQNNNSNIKPSNSFGNISDKSVQGNNSYQDLSQYSVNFKRNPSYKLSEYSAHSVNSNNNVSNSGVVNSSNAINTSSHGVNATHNLNPTGVNNYSNQSIQGSYELSQHSSKYVNVNSPKLTPTNQQNPKPHSSREISSLSNINSHTNTNNYLVSNNSKYSSNQDLNHISNAQISHNPASNPNFNHQYSNFSSNQVNSLSKIGLPPRPPSNSSNGSSKMKIKQAQQANSLTYQDQPPAPDFTKNVSKEFNQFVESQKEEDDNSAPVKITKQQYLELDNTPEKQSQNSKWMSTIKQKEYENSNISQSPSAEYDDGQQYVEEQYEIGTRYEGFKKNGMRNGNGKFYYREGSYYDGHWTDNQMDGFGRLFYPNGNLAYEGTWSNDQFHGQGTVYNDNPIDMSDQFDYTDFSKLADQWIKYDGQLHKDAKHGKGKLELTNGEVYEGNFQMDKIWGDGVFRRQGGNTVRGQWEDNRLKKVL